MKRSFWCKTKQLGRTILSLPVLVVALSLALAPIPTYAAHDTGLFELDIRMGVDGDQAKQNDPIPPWVDDANTVNNGAGDDWADIYADYIDGTPAGDNSGAFALAWIEDTFANGNVDNGAEPFVALRTPEVTFFTGGGSKDKYGIQDGPWLYDTVNDVVPDKNDIINAFAAAYDNPGDGHTYFYFGLDTFSVNGDANAGFWFFRHPVGLNPLEPGETKGTFFGEHTDGDIFVAVAYTQGGSVGDIDVYRWSGDDATGSLVLVASSQSCATSAPMDDVCGVINKLLPDQTFGEDPIFDYANTLVQNNPLDPTSYQYESAALVEFGLDVNAVLGSEIGCFTTFLAETRSSQSTSAQLKDFAFGDFPICSIAVEKNGETPSKIGDDVDYEIIVTNTGKATLYKQSIIDNVLGDLTGEAGCGASLAPGASCTINVTRTVEGTDPDPLDNTVTVVYTEFADPASLSFTDSDDHSVNLFQPSITLDKTGDTLSKVGDEVSYTITLSNTSSADTPDLECTITDAMLGINETTTLATGGNYVLNPTYIVQGGDSDPLVNTASATCSPVGYTNVVEASDDHSVNLFQPSVTLDKTGDELSKVGDSVDYVITVNNTSSDDTPAMECTITDALLGINQNATLASGESAVINASRVVQAGDPDPVENTASVSCSPVGYSNQFGDSDDHAVNLFQPDVEIIKTSDCPDGGIANGETLTYDYVINNLSSGDSPALVLESVVDNVLGDLTAVASANGCSSLGVGGSCSFSVPYLTDGLGIITNVVTALYHPQGYPNDVMDDDDETCEVILPAPARVVIEKVLLGAENIAFNYSDNNLTVPFGAGTFSLTPLFTPAIPQHGNSPFAAAPTLGDSFATTIEIVVEVPNVNSTVESSVSEDMPLPANTAFVGLQCAAAIGGNLSGESVVGAMATLTLGSGDFAFCRYTNEFVPPGEGCTPGFWRNHPDRWLETPYRMTDDFDSTFGVNLFSPDITLGEAIDNPQLYGQLAFHGTAALLSAAHAGVDYPYTEAQVIALVQSGDWQSLKEANELGCPLN